MNVAMNKCKIIFVALTLASVFAFVTGCATPSSKDHSATISSSPRYREKDFTPDFVQKCKARAEAGDAEGQALYGRALINGWGVEKNETLGVEWSRKSADSGNAIGQCNLGWCYNNGEGVAKDASKAVEWWRKSAEQGYAIAQFDLGSCYMDGRGVAKDATKAVEWYRKSAEQGNATAQCNLGWCYNNGEGVAKDASKAVEWYMKSADSGNAIGQCNLGMCYEYGQGVEKDKSKAVEWYRKSAEQGVADAQLNLGWCYFFGEGVAKDASKAVEWWRKSAEQGNDSAQYNLGCSYGNGEGVVKDMGMAKSWLEKAAAQGNKAAVMKLEDFSKSIWEATSEQMVELDQFWMYMARNISERVLDGKGSLEDIVKDFSCTDEGKAIVEAFGEEFLPNAFGNYEKTRDKATELLQTMKETFPSPVSEGADNYETYCKVLSRVCESQVNLFRARRELAHFYLLHKAGVITNDELAKVDKEKMRVLIRFEAGEAFSLSEVMKLDGNVAEFAEKFMPDSYKLYQTFSKEHGQLEGLYKELCADAEKVKACYYDGPFFACCQKSLGLTRHADALAMSFTELYTLHKIGDVDADGLSKRDAEMSASMKAFADSLPGFLRENAASPFANLFEMVPIPGKDYSICKYEVTQFQWAAVMGDKPSKFKGADLPVENVSWRDCEKFLKKLNALPEVKASGVVYRLPTADEWEYACRAGSEGEFGLLADGNEGTLDEMGWYDDNSGGKTHPVGQKKPNAFGLYDMHGNVWEWTSTAVGDSRVNCGGSWYTNAERFEADCRDRGYHYSHYSNVGFRLVSVSATKEE